MQIYIDALLKTLRTPEDAARALASVLVFEAMATAEMKQIRDTTLPKVLEWAEQAAPKAPKKAKTRDGDTATARILSAIQVRAPGSSAEEVANLLGMKPRKVTKLLWFLHKTGRISRSGEPGRFKYDVQCS